MSAPTEPIQGMGALPTEGGTAFRVWAPHADAVTVLGDFNEWRDDASPLQSEGNGYWYGFVAGAEPGHEYKYQITNGENSLSRVDPYAMQVTNSVGNGVIYDHAAFDWEGDSANCPPHHELVIYEMHIGSFGGQDSEGSVGHLDDATAKLDHLVDLGVNAIEIPTGSPDWARSVALAVAACGDGTVYPALDAPATAERVLAAVRRVRGDV